MWHCNLLVTHTPVCYVCIVNCYVTLLNWPIVSLLFLFIFFSMFFVLIHDYTPCFTGSPYCKFSYCKFSYYNYISIWPYYIVIHFTRRSTFATIPYLWLLCLNDRRTTTINSTWTITSYYFHSRPYYKILNVEQSNKLLQSFTSCLTRLHGDLCALKGL